MYHFNYSTITYCKLDVYIKNILINYHSVDTVKQKVHFIIINLFQIMKIKLSQRNRMLKWSISS